MLRRSGEGSAAIRAHLPGVGASRSRPVPPSSLGHCFESVISDPYESVVAPTGPEAVLNANRAGLRCVGVVVADDEHDVADFFAVAVLRPLSVADVRRRRTTVVRKVRVERCAVSDWHARGEDGTQIVQSALPGDRRQLVSGNPEVGIRRDGPRAIVRPVDVTGRYGSPLQVVWRCSQRRRAAVGLKPIEALGDLATLAGFVSDLVGDFGSNVGVVGAGLPVGTGGRPLGFGGRVKGTPAVTPG